MIDVCLVTWPNHPKRLEYFSKTVSTLQAGLRDPVNWYCSAESEESEDYREKLESYCETFGIELHWRDAPANLGANMNASLELGCSEYQFLVQDDWLLLHPIDLELGVDFCEEYRPDLLRYSYPDADYMRPTFTSLDGFFRKVDLDGLWPYGDDPHLRHRSFRNKWGGYLEGGGHGTASATLMKSLVEGDAFIVAADKCYFKHFGEVTSVINDERGYPDRRNTP